MKTLLLILAFSTLIAGKMSAKTYYVSTTGNNLNSGLTEALAWKTVTYAASSSSPVIAGDIIYVKAGNYGAEQVVFQKSGTAGMPISYIGYKTTPGDAPPLLVNNANAYTGFLSTDMPLFSGSSRASGTGFNCSNQKYLTIKNFQIQNYAYGFLAGATTQLAGNLVLYNINTMFSGDINGSYSGYGFMLGSMGTKFSNNNILEYCMAVNASAEGFGINGDYNTLTGCKVYSNENSTNGASTDYYILLCGSYNTVKNCYIERAPGLYHKGHGISVKSNAEQVIDKGLALPVINPQYNKILYCVAKNMGESFCVRHRGAQYNLFSHCKAIGTHTGAAGSSAGEGSCMVTRDGASNNTFDGCIAENCASGFKFMDTVEDGDTGTNPTGHPGNNNKYINCLIYNCYMGVDFNSYSIQSDAGNNTIANCTFYKTRYMHSASRHCANMKYIGNIYYGCLPASTGGSFASGTYSADVVANGATTYFKNCDFINIQGGMPTNFVASASGSIAADPLFVNATALDFHLSPASPCKDAGIAQTFLINDFDSILRPQGSAVDMGAFEYKVAGTALSATVSFTNVSCNGAANGSATVMASGGTAPYTYVWSNGQINALTSGLIAGNYSVIVSDATASSITLTVTIAQPLANVNTIVSQSNVSYSGGSDGAVTIASAGGTAPYIYLWTPSNQITASATGLSAGDYTIRVTDANGCIATNNITITQPGASTISATVSYTNVRCNGENNGSATVLASGGTAPYTYLWSNGQINAVSSGLIAGNYSVTVLDATASSKTMTVTITHPLVNINSVTDKSHVSYYGGNDGSLTMFSEGGTAPYAYFWSPSNKTTSTVTGLYAGDHTLRVTDANGCIATRTIAITQPAAPATLSATLSSTNVKCNGKNNGTATITAIGGKAPYKYKWSNGKTTPVISGLIAGTYSVTVSDVNQVSKKYSVTITQPAVNVNSVVDKSHISYYGGNDGWIIISSTGGTAPYAYFWSPSNKTTATATGLYAGNHVLKVTDANACVATRTISLTQPSSSAPIVTASTNPVVIVAGTNDSSVVSVSEAEESEQEDAINIFPNPTTGPFSIDISAAQIGSEVLVVVRDMLGKEFYSKVFIVSDLNEVIAVDNSRSLAPGVYTVVASSNDNIYEKKLIIQ